MKSYKSILAFCFLIMHTYMYGNNIQITNISITGQDTAQNFTLIQFNVSWSNSWRISGGPSNWDAAWIFIKYRANSTGPWLHASLHNTGHTNPSGSTIEPGLADPSLPFNASTNPAVGAFIFRSGVGSGTFIATGVKLRWNYGVNGIGDNDQVDIQLFGIEQVYVPQASFYVGSGGTENGAFYTYPTTTNPFLINSENAISVGTTAGFLYYPLTGGNPGDQLGPIPAAFPKGYNDFYFMKNEISQQGYTDFLNTLTRDQQNGRTGTDLASGITAVTNRYVMSTSTTMMNRNGIRCDATIPMTGEILFYCDFDGDGIGGETTDGKEIACNFLSWADVSAYLAWAGLRPITELELEKASRGTVAPIPNEFAWGSNSYIQVTGISNQGLNNEGPTNVTANLIALSGGGVSGPIRVGAFATSSSNRSQAGASYYGIMEISGNVTERAVTVGKPEGRAYTGKHGSGTLDVNGNQNVPNWPSATTAEGGGIRSGNWSNSIVETQTSSRQIAASNSNTRVSVTGGRGGRTAQ